MATKNQKQRNKPLAVSEVFDRINTKLDAQISEVKEVKAETIFNRIDQQLNQKNMIVLLDNGHGGLINGTYVTPGKRKDWGNGDVIFEGEFNRAIVNGIIEELTRLKIPYVNIAPEYRDVRLETRVRRANEYPASKSFYLSIHSNAGGGTGSEMFTSPGDTKSDKIATIFGKAFENEFPSETLRTDFTDGDLDKERRFYVLTKTRMPAILTENFFMDNRREFDDILMTKEGREKIISYHIAAILKVQQDLF